MGILLKTVGEGKKSDVYKRQKAGLKNPALYLMLKQNIKLIC